MTGDEEIDGWDFVVGAFEGLDVATLADVAVNEETLVVVFHVYAMYLHTLSYNASLEQPSILNR